MPNQKPKPRRNKEKPFDPVLSPDADRSSESSPNIVDAIWYLAIIPSFWAYGYTVMRGSDLWWHIATGRWIALHKAIPMVDEWSFTAARQPWLQHEWLSDLSFQAWVSAFGLYSLVYWKWLMIVLTFGLLFHTARRMTGDAIASYAAVLLAIATAAPFIDIRPHLYSYLGFVLILHLVLGREKTPVYLPAIFLIWVNLHGGFILGLIALFILLAPKVIYGDRAIRVRSIVIWAASAAACLINPNGYNAFAYPLKYAFDSSSLFAKVIDEWAPPFAPGGIQSAVYPYCIGVFVLATLFILAKPALRKQKLNWAMIALGILTLAMSLTSRRFILVFAISQSLVTATAIAVAIAPYVKKVPAYVAPAAVALLGIFWLYPYPISPYAFHYLTAEDEFPIETANFIEANHLSGNVFAYYNWGGYLHYRTAGAMKVFIDGRADTVYDNATLQQYSQVQNFKPGWEDALERSGAQFVLWPRNEQGRPMAQLITSGRWRVLTDDFVSVLLVRSDQSLPETMENTPDSAYKQLTSGIQYQEQKKYDLAEEYFKLALSKMPYLRTACNSLVQAQTAQGKKDEAAKTLSTCNRNFPNSASAESSAR